MGKPLKPILRGYRDGDEGGMVARADFAAAFVAERCVLPAGPKWTMTTPAGEILGVAGVEPLGDQTWAAWAYMTDLRPRDWLAVAAFARDILAHVRDAYRARKIQAVAAPVKGARRLLKRIGFEWRLGEIHTIRGEG